MEGKPPFRVLMCEAENAIATLGRVVDTLAAELLPEVIAAREVSSAYRVRLLRSLDLIREQVGAVSQQVETAQNVAKHSSFARIVVPAGVGRPRPNFAAAPVAATKAAAKPAMIEVADGLSVPAMVLPETCRTRSEVLEAIRGPMLCYVPAWGHFAIRMGDMLIHGNIGTIFDGKVKHPVGVKACRDLACADPGCAYYHDPAKTSAFTQSTAQTIAPDSESPLHVRNFFAENFVYSPRFRGSKPPSRYGRRHYGSAGSLSADLALMADSEADRFLAQVGHDLVCAAVLLSNRQ